MITRRNLLLASLLTAACAAAGTARADDAAKAFLKDPRRLLASIPRASCSTPTPRCVLFRPKLAAMMIRTARTRRSAVMSPSSTAIRSSARRIGRSARSRSRCRSGARQGERHRLSNLKMPTTVTYDLVKFAGWRIADISWGDNDSCADCM